MYRVETSGGRELGSLEQAYVDRLVAEMSAFLLAGRAWLVEAVNHEDKRVRVRAAPGGQKPSWGSFVPSLLGFELCQRMKRLLASDEQVPYLEPSAAHALAALREDLGALLRRPLPLQMDGGAARWWTFAGGRVNHTVKYALELSQGWKVVTDNVQLRVEGDGVTDERVRTAIRSLQSDEFWADPQTGRALLARLPPYRLSKFQDVLPAAMAVETIENYLLDVKTTRQFLLSATSG
jgi:ATP-dependent Lhr-like helicase